jgi:hypothetical protein
MSTVIEYILLSFPLLTHVAVDFKGKVNHSLNALYVTAIAIVVGLFLPGYWWQGAIYSLAIHFTFFDPIYNITHHKPFFYHGDPDNPDRALTDQFWDINTPVSEVFVRLWVLSVGIGVYYHLDKIISF